MKLSFLTIFLLLSCSNTYRFYENEMSIALQEQKNHADIKTFDGDVEPTNLDLKLINSTVEGIDSNNNGIRDDIEVWANRTTQNEYLRKAIKYSAQIQRELLEALIKNDRDKINKLISKEFNLSFCRPSLGQLTSNELELEIVTFSKMWANTPGRKDLEKKHDWYSARNHDEYDPKTFKCEFAF